MSSGQQPYNKEGIIEKSSFNVQSKATPQGSRREIFSSNFEATHEKSELEKFRTLEHFSLEKCCLAIVRRKGKARLFCRRETRRILQARALYSGDGFVRNPEAASF